MAAYVKPESGGGVLLQAEPSPLEIELNKTAVIVIDMQNAFVSKGGMFDLWGRDILKSQEAIEPIKNINNTARAKGLKVIYVVHMYAPDLSNSGGPNSPNWNKRTLTNYRANPEWRDKLTISGTWGSEIVHELKPQEGDILVVKPRYSAFFGTNLDTILKTYSIRFLIFVGVATNICVESSILDSFQLEYFPILVSDAVASSGPPFMQEAAIHNIKSCYGWITTSTNIMEVMG
ncbi:isochorismatase family protein [Chloroflexota bacterium]